MRSQTHYCGARLWSKIVKPESVIWNQSLEPESVLGSNSVESKSIHGNQIFAVEPKFVQLSRL